MSLVIVDTSIWVTALRKRDSFERTYLAQLVTQARAAIVGLVLGEVLRGSRSQSDFDELLDELSGCEFIGSSEETWREAGQIMLDLRLKGEAIPFQDAIIAAHGLVSGHEIYSSDEHFQRVSGVRLHEPLKN